MPYCSLTLLRSALHCIVHCLQSYNGRREIQLITLCLASLAFVLAWASLANADITGTPRVIDGDTIEVAGQ
jgi:hypothetical protein